MDGELEHREHRGGYGLGGGDGHFDAGTDAQGVVGKTGGLGVVVFDDRDEFGTEVAGDGHSGYGVGGLAGLGDADDEGAFVDHRLAVAVFGGVGGVGVDARDGLKVHCRQFGGVEGCAHSDDGDVVDLTQHIGVQLVGAHSYLAGAEVDALAHRADDGVRLFGDLFGHKVGVGTFGDLGGVSAERHGGFVEGLTLKGQELEFVGGGDEGLTGVKEEGLFELGLERDGVAGDHRGGVVGADDESAGAADFGTHNGAGLVGVEGEEG